MPANYIEIAPISSPPKKRKRTEASATSPPTTVPVMFPSVVYPFMFPGYPAMPAQWMPPILQPPVFGLGSPLPQPQIAQKPVGQCTITKVPTESTGTKSPIQNLVAQIDAMTPPVLKQQPRKSTKPLATKESSPPKKQEPRPIVIQPVSQKRSRTGRAEENESSTSSTTAMELRRKVYTLHTSVLNDLMELQLRASKNQGQATKVLHDYSVDVSAIETQRGHALLVAVDKHNRQSIEFYYDQKRHELIEKNIAIVTMLKSGVTAPTAASSPTMTSNVHKDSRDEEPTTDANKGTNQKVTESCYVILNQWYEDFRDCPYASPEDVVELSEKTGLTISQVRKWLGNRRLRDKDNKVCLRKYDSKIILGHLRQRNKERKEQLQQQQKQSEEDLSISEQQQHTEETSLNIKIESVISLA